MSVIVREEGGEKTSEEERLTCSERLVLYSHYAAIVYLHQTLPSITSPLPPPFPPSLIGSC